MFGLIRQFIKGLTKDTSPGEIAGGIAFGFLLGLIPKSNLTAQILIILVLALKINIPFFFLSMLCFTFLSFIFDKISDPVGYYVLTNQSLYPLWVKIYNMPIVPWTDFNNTVLIGGFITGIVLFVPVYFLGRKFAVVYNEKFKNKFVESKLVKTFKKSWLLDWYFKEI